MKTDEKILEDLRIIDKKAKFMGIKIIMIRHLIESHMDNKQLLHKVLESTKNTELHNLILTACPQLEKILDTKT